MTRKRISRLLAPALVVLAYGALSAARAQPLGLPPDLSSDAEARGFADLLFAHGMTRLADEEYEDALPFFEKAAAAWPGDATYAYFAALCRLRLGRPAEAIAGLTAVLPPASSRVPEARIRYDLGDARYLKGDLRGAEGDLRSSLRLDERDAWAHFYLGLTLFALGKGEEAMAEFERAISLDPSLAADGSYYRGIAAYRRGDAAAARGFFEDVIVGAPSAEIGASGREWLDALGTPGEASGPPKGEFRFGLSVEHDDNPGLVNETFPFSVAESDVRSVLQAHGALQPMADGAGWTLGLVFNGYASRHHAFEEFDLRGVQGMLQLARGRDPLGYVNGPLGYARVPVGEARLGFLFQAGASLFDLDTRAFRRDREASASVRVGQPGIGTTQVDLQYADTTFFAPPHPFSPDFSILSGDAWTVRLGQYFTLGDRPERWLRIAVARTAAAAEVQELDRDVTRFLAEIALPVSTTWTLFLHGSRAEEDYDPGSAVFFGEPREDTRTDLSATAAIELGPHAYLVLRTTWVDREVRPEVLGYDRRIGSAGITWHW